MQRGAFHCCRSWRSGKTPSGNPRSSRSCLDLETRMEASTAFAPERGGGAVGGVHADGFLQGVDGGHPLPVAEKFAALFFGLERRPAANGGPVVAERVAERAGDGGSEPVGAVGGHGDVEFGALEKKADAGREIAAAGVAESEGDIFSNHPFETGGDVGHVF